MRLPSRLYFHRPEMVMVPLGYTYYDATGIAAIANIPSRDELLAKFLGSIQSPITNFARVIKQIAEKNEEVA